MAIDIGDAVLKVGLDTSPLDRDVAKLKKKVDDDMKNMQKHMAVAGAAIVGAIAGIGFFATKAAVDFEDAFAGVRKTVDATEEVFEELSDGIRGLSKELPITATELAGVAEAAGQLGISTEFILEFTEVMAGLGIATSLSAEEAAIALARFANVTGMAEGNVSNLGSVIVALGNSMATTETEIVTMAQRLAGAGTVVGLTEADILGLSASLSAVGIAAERGGTAISRVMIDIEKSVKAGGAELEKFAQVAGVSAEEFGRKWEEDAAGALTIFIEGLGRMIAEGDNVFPFLEEMGLADIRVRDSLLLLAQSEGLMTEALQTAADAWEEDIALKEEVAKRNETMASKMTILKNSFNDVMISLGEGLMPIIQAFMGVIGPIIEAVGGWIDNNKTLAIALMGLVGTGGALLLLLGILPKIKAAILAVRTAMIALSANPVILIIAVIVAAVAGAVMAIRHHWDTIKTIFATAVRAILEKAIKPLISALASVIDFGSKVVGFFNKELAASMKKTANSIRGAVDGAIEWTHELENTAKAAQVQKTAVDGSSDAVEDNTVAVRGNVEAIGDASQATASYASNVGHLNTQVDQSTEAHEEWAKQIADSEAKVEAVWQQVIIQNSELGKLGITLEDVIQFYLAAGVSMDDIAVKLRQTDGAVDQATALWNGLGGAVELTAQKMDTTFPDAVIGVVDSMGDMLDSISPAAKEWEDMGVSGADALQALVDNTDLSVTQIGAIFVRNGIDLNNWGSKWRIAFKEAGVDVSVLDGLINDLSDSADEIAQQKAIQTTLTKQDTSIQAAAFASVASVARGGFEGGAGGILLNRLKKAGSITELNDLFERMRGLQADHGGWQAWAIAGMPGLANGGIAMRPMLASIAEKGPEAVIPLDKLQAMMGGKTINLTIEMDGRQMARVLGAPLVDEIRLKAALRI